jgi:hypothetical protein
MHVNLLPPEFVARQRLILSIKRSSLAISLWVLTLGAVIAPLEIQAIRIQQELERYHAEVGPLRMKENKTRQIRSITRDLENRTERIQSVLPPNRIPSVLGIFGKTFHSDSYPIAIQDLNLSMQHDFKGGGQSPGRPSAPAGKSGGKFTTQIILRGYTGAEPSVAEVIQQLDAYGVFQNVLLRSAKDTMVANRQVDEFELECSYAE